MELSGTATPFMGTPGPPWVKQPPKGQKEPMPTLGPELNSLLLK